MGCKAMSVTSKSNKTVQLDWADEHGQITVTPRNQDRFTIKIRKAVEALQMADAAEAFEGQLQLLLSELASWIQGETGLREAHLTMQEGAFAFVVVTKTATYDSEFEDRLTDLDLAIAQDPDLDMIELNVTALPDVSQNAVESFLDSSFSMSYQMLDE